MRASSEKSEKSTARKVVSYLSTALIAAVFVAVVATLISAFAAVGKGQPPSVFGYRFYTVLTDSMTPTIEVGDVIISKKVTEKQVKELQTGDIITYVAEKGDMAGKAVTHRIVEGVHYDEAMGAEVVTTRGDKAGATLDYPVRVERIQSVMVKKSDGLKRFYALFRGGAGFAVLIILPLGVMLIVLVVRLVLTLRSPSAVEAAEAPTPVEAAEAERAARIEEIKARAIAEYVNGGGIATPEAENSAHAEEHSGYHAEASAEEGTAGPIAEQGCEEAVEEILNGNTDGSCEEA